jgi:short subunit dehydrogenase-like uncharacterized protein
MDSWRISSAGSAPIPAVGASGPLQSYGEKPYELIESCVACGIHYMDFANGAAFVTGVAAFDQRARQRDALREMLGDRSRR